jgi:hypothetical protein
VAGRNGTLENVQHPDTVAEQKHLQGGVSTTTRSSAAAADLVLAALAQLQQLQQD